MFSQGVTVDVRCHDLLREAAYGLSLAFPPSDDEGGVALVVLIVGGLLVGVAIIGGKGKELFLIFVKLEGSIE